MRHWLGCDRAQIASFMADNGLPAYRTGQVWDWLHAKRVAHFDDMSNLPKDLRCLMARDGELRVLEELERRDADDRLTAKWLFAAPAANAAAQAASLVESVLIVEKKHSRRTVCASSMIGCPLDCSFCATGQLGFVRNLAPGEIIEQVYRLDAWSRIAHDGEGVTHVVFMGMGEPLLNLGAVVQAAAVFCDPDGMALSGRHITISTAGVPEGIRRLADMDINYRLALSLHAPNQVLREKLMPSAKRWPLAELFPALEKFAAVASRDITFEYCLIDRMNSALADARELAQLIKPFRCKINLIPMNPVPGCDHRPPPPEAIRAFQASLENAGVPVTVRMEKGAGIGAACGQLRADRHRDGG